MKLGALKQAIRDLDQAPKVAIRFASDRTLDIHAQKTPLLAALDEEFSEGKAQETGLYISPDGYLTREQS